MQEDCAHHPLARALLAEGVTRLDRERLWNEVMQENLEFKCRDILVSSEVFQSVRNPKLFVSHIPTNGVLFITYVRNPVDYFISTYQQHVYATAMTATPEARALHYAFRLFPFMKRLRSDLQEQVVFREFERNKLKDGDIVSDFFSAIGSLEVNFRGESQNPSISGNLLLFKLALNTTLRGRTSRETLDVLDRVAFENERFSRRLRVSQDLFSFLSDLFEDDIRLIRRDFLPEFFAPAGPSGHGFDFATLSNDFHSISESFISSSIEVPSVDQLLDVVDSLGVHA